MSEADRTVGSDPVTALDAVVVTVERVGLVDHSKKPMVVAPFASIEPLSVADVVEIEVAGDVNGTGDSARVDSADPETLPSPPTVTVSLGIATPLEATTC